MSFIFSLPWHVPFSFFFFQNYIFGHFSFFSFPLIQWRIWHWHFLWLQSNIKIVMRWKVNQNNRSVHMHFVGRRECIFEKNKLELRVLMLICKLNGFSWPAFRKPWIFLYYLVIWACVQKSTEIIFVLRSKSSIKAAKPTNNLISDSLFKLLNHWIKKKIRRKYFFIEECFFVINFLFLYALVSFQFFLIYMRQFPAIKSSEFDITFFTLQSSSSPVKKTGEESAVQVLIRPGNCNFKVVHFIFRACSFFSYSTSLSLLLQWQRAANCNSSSFFHSFDL